MRSAISSAIWRASELADITRLLGGIGDGGGGEAGAGRDAGALDERAVGAGTDPAGGYHPDAPGDPPDEFGSSFGDAVAVRDGHCAYHGVPPVPYCRTWIGISEGTPVTRAVERAAHILLALASGTPPAGRVGDRRTGGGPQAHRAHRAAHAGAAGSGRPGGRRRQVRARAGRTAAGQP